MLFQPSGLLLSDHATHTHTHTHTRGWYIYVYIQKGKGYFTQSVEWFRKEKGHFFFLSFFFFKKIWDIPKIENFFSLIFCSFFFFGISLVSRNIFFSFPEKKRLEQHTHTKREYKTLFVSFIFQRLGEFCWPFPSIHQNGCHLTLMAEEGGFVRTKKKDPFHDHKEVFNSSCCCPVDSSSSSFCFVLFFI